MIRIGFDANRLFTNRTGLGNYSRNLLNNLAYYYPDHAYFLYTHRLVRNPETRFFLNSPLFHVTHPRGFQRFFWNSELLPETLKRRKVALFHGLSNELPSGLRGLPIRRIVTIHDLVFKRHPKFYRLADRVLLHAKTRYACEHAQQIIATSEHTRKDILEFYDVPEEKVKVIYQTCSERFLQEKAPRLLEGVVKKYRIPEAYFLYVGAITERKNLLGVVQALQQLPAGLRLPLVVIGSGTTYKIKVQSFLLRHRMLDQVHFIQADPQDLPAIYQKAALFLYPSFYEGFGIPVLEALFSRTPVVTSNRSSLPEVAGPGAYLADPYQPESIAEGIQQLLGAEDYRQQAIESGYRHALGFHGEVLAEKMMNTYYTLLGRRDIPRKE
ncbi:MAG: D-inositol-3-phosphate glycosyltransferase [Haliscomenobacter sp.]|jgi:glycosyltransferase involved in cell wall biosynthesis|nr:D-inositol-3-phosphate glycosyltransferase [Haliscomenobacter sp.]